MTTDLVVLSPLRHDPRAIREGLRDDLRALAAPGVLPDIWDVVTRPSLLRRVAMLLAEQVQADTDRVVASEQDAALVAAVSLHTGVPFAIVAPDSSVYGELHSSEHICWVEFQPGLAESVWLQTLRDREVHMSTRLSVFETNKSSTSTSLFRLWELQNNMGVHPQ